MEQFEYYAFISYKREDEKWAKWLQEKLESYTLPIALRKENHNFPKKIRPIFRDQSDLSSGKLKEEIERALENSKFLIVICSTRSAKSIWVSKEVEYFINSRREDMIIPFIIDGIPNSYKTENECFPKGLLELTGDNEILGININEMGDEAAVIKVVSRMFNLRFDVLWQRYERSRRKRLYTIVLLILFIGLIGYIFGAILFNKNIRLRQISEEILKEKEKVESLNKIISQSRDSLLRQNLIMTDLNLHLANLSDSLISSNNSLRIANISLMKGKNGTEEMFYLVMRNNPNKELLRQISLTYKNLGGSEHIVSNMNSEINQIELLYSDKEISKIDSVNIFRLNKDSLENKVNLFN